MVLPLASCSSTVAPLGQIRVSPACRLSPSFNGRCAPVASTKIAEPVNKTTTPMFAMLLLALF